MASGTSRFVRAAPGDRRHGPRIPDGFLLIAGAERAAFDAHQARAAASPWGAASRHLVREYTITGGA